MGFFTINTLESKLKRYYVDMFTGMGMSNLDAQNMFTELLNKAKEEMSTNGEDRIPDDMADRIISDPKLASQYQKRKNDGVMDEDIRWWYGMTSLERSLMLQVDEMHKMNLVISLLGDGEDMDEAANKVQKFHPIYGDSDDTSKFEGEDRPLHAELKDRINIYIEKRFLNDNENYKKDIEKSTSFNSLVRKEIKAGNL